MLEKDKETPNPIKVLIGVINYPSIPLVMLILFGLALFIPSQGKELSRILTDASPESQVSLQVLWFIAQTGDWLGGGSAKAISVGFLCIGLRASLVILLNYLPGQNWIQDAQNLYKFGDNTKSTLSSDKTVFAPKKISASVVQRVFKEDPFEIECGPRNRYLLGGLKRAVANDACHEMEIAAP